MEILNLVSKHGDVISLVALLITLFAMVLSLIQTRSLKKQNERLEEHASGLEQINSKIEGHTSDLKSINDKIPTQTIEAFRDSYRIRVKSSHRNSDSIIKKVTLSCDYSNLTA